jgi:hypothetical protein
MECITGRHGSGGKLLLIETHLQEVISRVYPRSNNMFLLLFSFFFFSFFLFLQQKKGLGSGTDKHREGGKVSWPHQHSIRTPAI